MKFTIKEIKELFIAWIMTSLAFAILFSGGLELFKSINSFMIYFLFSCLTAGIGFVFHEIMHKYLAQKYDLFAEFRAFYQMLFIALLFSFGGFIIAAPGAVYITGHITKEKNGKISLAGPLTNILLAIISLILIFLIKPIGLFEVFLKISLSINSVLGLFNLIPGVQFDGKGIYDWNKTIYFSVLIIAFLLFISSFYL